MRCPECGLLNPDTALYCADCGFALSGCDVALPAADEADLQQRLTAAKEAVRRLRRYVPAVIAEDLLHDQERLRGERREVAILFADAVNFTRLAAALDAESVFNLVNELLSRLVQCVHRYDGLVDKFTGDGLMAIFGAPIAHENDPELAIRTALDMQEVAIEFEPTARAQLGVPLQIRVGIHSGPVVAGIIGNQRRVAYTVIGEAVNLAARLEAAARPGHILVSPRVYHQTQALFNFQAMGMTKVKGLSRPVGVYEVLGDRSESLPMRGLTGVTSILLGRDAELERLRDLLVAFLDDRKGRLVMIEGEAGMGKSHLVAGWLSMIEPDQITIWHGSGLPYTKAVGFSIFRSLLQDAVRVSSSGSVWDAHVSPPLRLFLWQILGSLAPEEQATLRNLEPERVKRLTISALREWIMGAARMRRIVLVLENFQWADDLSREALRSLIGMINEVPVLLCITMRPQPKESMKPVLAVAEESLDESLRLSLELGPLSPEDCRRLLNHIVDLESLPDRLVDTILSRAEGNPLYIEEFIRMLIEKDILKLRNGQWQVVLPMALHTLEIPTTLRGLVMARVDRLPENLRHVLRDASVIGMQFDARLLAEVESHIRDIEVLPLLEWLADLGLLMEQPQVGEKVYSFRHVLTHETIYNSLLRSQRVTMHQAVAECIESLYADDLENQAEVLALHYDRASVRDKAMRYSLQAGDRARERFANREAVEYYSRALQLSQYLRDCGVERWQATIGLGEVEGRIGEYEEAIACYQAALEEWSEATPEDRARAMLGLGQAWDKRGELREAENWLLQALAQLRDTYVALPALRAQIYSELGWLKLRKGDLSAAQERLEEGLALVGETEHYVVLSSILDRLGLVHYNRGEQDLAAERIKSALEHRRRMGDLVGQAHSLNHLGILKQASGDWEGALTDYERAAELYERIGESEGLSQISTNLGVLYTERGEWAKAERNIQRSLAIAQSLAQPYKQGWAHANLGRLYLLQGRWADCAWHLNAAIPLHKQVGSRARLDLSDVYRLQSLLHLEQNQIEAAEQWAKRSHDLLQEMTGADEGESIRWCQYERLMARIAQARGDLAAAHGRLERSATISQACGSQLEIGRTAYWNSLLLSDQPQKAREELEKARRIFERLGARADLQRVEERMAQEKMEAES